MKTAFLTEMNWTGKVPANHLNMRTEIAWMFALQSDHFNIHDYEKVTGYDAVFIIFPKATVKLNSVGCELSLIGEDKDITIYHKPIVEILKKTNGKVCNIQEGPSWFFNDYDLLTQFNFYNQLSECDVLFTHNEHDVHFYKGLFPQSRIEVIPSLMITDTNLFPVTTVKEDKVIIGGNFSRWYGGFQSYITATEFNVPIYVPSSHCKRKGEEQVPNLKHLPWIMWNEWMKQLSTFKYAVNLMPTVAAGTFSMNCAYYGIPCIGNEKVDTQSKLFPELSVDVEDVYSARKLAIQLRDDKEFYEHIKYHSQKTLINSLYNDYKRWLMYIENILMSIPSEVKSISPITVVFTSCGRFDLLKRTVDSFVMFNSYPIKKYLVIDNSAKPEAKSELEKIFKTLNGEIIVNSENIGQVSSIDKAYSKVTTEYIFHCEDDWEFFDSGFIEKSLDVLNHDSKIINVNVRVRFDGERGSMHPVSDTCITSNNTRYHEYIPNYLGTWHGFSWNPGLRRLSDYNSIKPYKQFGEESGVGKKYYDMGKRSACLKTFYCKHIGQDSTTEKRNM